MKYRTKTATSWTEAIRRHGERRDEPHGPAAFRTGRRIGAVAVVRFGRGRFFLCVRCRLDLVCQERATEGQPFRSMAIGEESEVSNAMEAVGQGVEQEAPDELVRLQTHGLNGAVVAIVLPGEPDMFVVAGLDAAVGDGDAMGVAAEIGKNLRGSAEGLLGVDDPIEATHRG